VLRSRGQHVGGGAAQGMQREICSDTCSRLVNWYELGRTRTGGPSAQMHTVHPEPVSTTSQWPRHQDQSVQGQSMHAEKAARRAILCLAQVLCAAISTPQLYTHPQVPPATQMF
jgi:hypothetical protein